MGKDRTALMNLLSCKVVLSHDDVASQNGYCAVCRGRAVGLQIGPRTSMIYVWLHQVVIEVRLDGGAAVL